MNENEKVVSRAVPARSPHDRDSLLREMIGPISYLIPIACFVAVVIEAILGRLKNGKAVMFSAGAQEACPDLSFAIGDEVGHREAKRIGIEVHQPVS
jgi:hypothetical protein